MACFSLAWLMNLLIWLVIIGAIIMLLKLLLPYILSPLGQAGAVVAGAIKIILWAVVAIFLIYLIFSLISCLGGSLSFPRLH